MYNSEELDTELLKKRRQLADLQEEVHELEQRNFAIVNEASCIVKMRHELERLCNTEVQQVTLVKSRGNSQVQIRYDLDTNHSKLDNKDVQFPFSEFVRENLPESFFVNGFYGDYVAVEFDSNKKS